MPKTTKPSSILPVLPISQRVSYPGMSLIIRSPHTAVIKSAMTSDSRLIVVTQKEEAERLDCYDIGVVCVVNIFSMPGKENMAVEVKGINRVKIKKWIKGDCLKAEYEEITDSEVGEAKLKAHLKALTSALKEYSSKENSYKVTIPDEPETLEETRLFVYGLAHSMKIIRVSQKQEILEEKNIEKQIEIIIKAIEKEISMLDEQAAVRENIRRVIQNDQKAVLERQLRALQDRIQKIHGGGGDQITKFREKLNQLKPRLSEGVFNTASMEIDKLVTLTAYPSAEITVVQNYLELLLDLPWGVNGKKIVTQDRAKRILDESHYGLDEIKKKVLGYVAVQEWLGHVPHVVLCFVGPPGTGKTTLAKKVAEAMGRSCHVISFAGLTDPATLVGHRRTYIGAMPGEIIDSLRKEKSDDFVLVFDEVGTSGDPRDPNRANALQVLRQVLDPSQNKKFVDKYLDAPYDLSQIIMILTANEEGYHALPDPIKDRTMPIYISGYNKERKKEIVKFYIIPKALSTYKIEDLLTITEESIDQIIEEYTGEEAGVRSLERAVQYIIHETVKILQSQKEKGDGQPVTPITVTPEILKEMLGRKNAHRSFYNQETEVGSVNGLAVSAVGGVMCGVQASLAHGSGKVVITGNLQKIMKESAETVLNLLKSNFDKYRINPEIFKQCDIYLHFPEAPVPKDGASAGVTIFTALLSLLTGFPVMWDIAMTGEATLRGQVLRIGGIEEKVMAAAGAGIRKVLAPKDNQEEVDEILKKTPNIEIVCISSVDEIPQHVFSEEDYNMFRSGKNKFKFPLQANPNKLAADTGSTE